MPPITSNTASVLSPLLTVAQVSEMLSVRPYTIRAWCNSGRLHPVHRLPSNRAGWRIPESTVAAYLIASIFVCNSDAAVAVVDDDPMLSFDEDVTVAPTVRSRGARR